MSDRRPTLALSDLILTVHRLDVRLSIGRPALAEVAVTLPEPPTREQLRGWLGTKVALRCNDPDEAVETWRIAEIEATGRQLSLHLSGALATLALGGGAAWLANASLLDCACSLLGRHEIGSRVSVSANVATMALPLVVQPATDDLTFLQHLGFAGGFLAVDTLDDSGEVALVEGPTLGHGTVRQLADSAKQPRLFARRTALASLTATVEAAGTRFYVISGTGDTPRSVLPGVTLANDALKAQIEARARRGGPVVTRIVETYQAGARPGWQVDVADLANGLFVTSVARTLDGNGRVRSTLHLAERSDFATTVLPLPLPSPIPLQIARVADPGAGELKGYLTLTVDGPEGGKAIQFPAQITAQGSGTGSGASVLPQAGASVLVAFAGDGLMPRPFVLGTLRDHKDPPPQHMGKPADALMIAHSTNGAEVILTRGADGDTLIMSVGDGQTKMTLRPNGSISLVGSEISIEADALTLRGCQIRMEEK